MDEQQNLQYAKCGYALEELRYSDIARRLLHTNEPPQSVDNNDEAAFIRGEMKHGHEMLASIDKDLASIEKDIVALQVMLNSLQEKQKQVQKFVDDHAAFLSPFRRIRLPSEVWMKIFHFAEPVVDTDVEGGIWRLGQVCSYWRSVLISSPSLWSTIDVQWGRVRIIQEMLSRSGSLLLDITLGGSWPRPTTEITSSVIRTVITASLRWHRITFRDIPNPVLPLFSQLKDRVPMLAELEYRGPMFPEWLEGAPLLRKLTVYSSHPLSLSLDLPWSNIRDCDVRPLTLTQEHQLLRQCPNLETYMTTSREQTDPVPPDMLCLSELHTLILRDNTTLMDFLILPHLDHVSVESYNPTLRQRLISSLHNLLSRSQCFPSKLNIYSSSDDIVVQLVSLVSFQNLTTLGVTCSSNFKFSTLFPVLTIRPESSSVLLPQLERLYLCLSRFSRSPPTVEDMGLLTEMVRSRWHPHENAGIRNRLAFFEFKAYPYPSILGALAPLLVFSDEGLELYLLVFGDEFSDEGLELDLPWEEI